MSEDNKFKSRLLTLLLEHFGSIDLELFCFNFGIDPENLKRSTKQEQAIALLRYLENRDKLSLLLDWMKKERPNLVEQVNGIEKEVALLGWPDLQNNQALSLDMNSSAMKSIEKQEKLEAHSQESDKAKSINLTESTDSNQIPSLNHRYPFLRVAAFIIVVLCLLWFVFEPGWEPTISFITALVAAYEYIAVRNKDLDKIALVILGAVLSIMTFIVILLPLFPKTAPVNIAMCISAKRLNNSYYVNKGNWEAFNVGDELVVYGNPVDVDFSEGIALVRVIAKNRESLTVQPILVHPDIPIRVGAELDGRIENLGVDGLVPAEPTGTLTPISTATPTVTDTPASTATPTVTDTPVVTVTPTITNSPIPSDTLEACVPTLPSGWVRYYYRTGDYLSNLANVTGTTVERIEEVSCVSATMISVGTQIFLPFLPATDTPLPIDTPHLSDDGNDGGSPDVSAEQPKGEATRVSIGP